MDWLAIHAYAEEVELWTSLVINMWLLAGAIGFAFVRARRIGTSLGDQLVIASEFSVPIIFGILCIASAIGATNVLLHIPSPLTRQFAGDLAGAFLACVVTGALAIVYLGQLLNSHDKSNEK